MPTLGRRQACAPSQEQEEQMIRNDVAGAADVADVAGRRPARRCWLRRLPGRGSSATVVRASAWSGLLLALALAAVSGWGSVPWWSPLALGLVVTLAQVAVVPLQLGRQRWPFSLTEAALGAALVASTGAWSVVSVAVGVAVAQRLRAQRVDGNVEVAQFAVAVALAQAVAGMVGGDVLGACAGLAVFWVVKHVLVGVAGSLVSGDRLRPLLLSAAPLSAVHTAGSCSVGLLAAFLAREAPLGLLGLVVPLALLWSSYDQQTRGAAEARLYAELAQGQERATGRSSQVSASVVVTAAARLLGGADVELVLLTADGPVRYHADEAGGAQGRRVRPGAFDPPWALRALGQTGVVTGTDEAGPWLSALIGTPDAPAAVLRARRPGGAGGFGRRETRLVDVLVVQAETWLSAAQTSALPPRAAHPGHRADPTEQAARALGDVGAATAPALSMLRESADRLARLAETPDGVEHIVEELHHVERAVASLLGAVALAAEPDLLRLPEPDERPRPESASDWTTTGVLA
jgi:hypothetical protein